MTWRTQLTHEETKSLASAESIIEQSEHGALILNAQDEIRKLKHIGQRRARAKRKAAE